MQAQSTRPVRTFTIGFSEPEYDESGFAREIARHLGTDHTELTVTPEEAQALIPELPAIYDEPLADASQIPTILVARLARAHVTVSLSGDAGDELFGGYNRYVWGPEIAYGIGRLPQPVRGGIGSLLSAIPTGVYDAGARALGTFPRRGKGAGGAPGRFGAGGRVPSSVGDKAHKYAALLPYTDTADLYDRLFTQWSPRETGLSTHHWPTPPRGAATLAEQMMFWDATQFLPDDILVKVDRAAMSVGLETRVPLLDPEVAAFAWRLPLGHRIDGGVGKAVLRRVAYRHVPRALLERPKMGFRVPLDHWLRGPLRAWAEDLLAPDRLRRHGLLDPGPIRQVWAEHLSGRRNWQYKLWAVLMLEAWIDRYHR
jgi:asparagine synthase (glutamine-hydrolysing)